MGLSKARDSNLLDGEKGDSLPILLAYPAAFRETAYRRWRRQATTLAGAVRAGRARAKTDPQRHGTLVDAAALRDLVATVAADVRLVRVPVNQPPWTPTGLVVTAGDDVSWLAWGSPHLVWPLSVAVRPRAEPTFHSSLARSRSMSERSTGSLAYRQASSASACARPVCPPSQALIAASCNRRARVSA
jgi:hypothetical protein